MELLLKNNCSPHGTNSMIAKMREKRYMEGDANIFFIPSHQFELKCMLNALLTLYLPFY